MDTIGMTAIRTQPGSSWLKSGGAAVAGAVLGFALGMATLSSPWGGSSPGTAALPLAQPAMHEAAGASFSSQVVQVPPSASWTDPAPAAGGGLEPCWATVTEPVHC
jgi:hypothetical protein